LDFTLIQGSGTLVVRWRDLRQQVGGSKELRESTFFSATMADVFSKTKRSWVMGRIRGVNTKPEKLVRSFLHCHGLRFRLHQRNLPGNPDIVLARHKTVVFVNGCFWHHHFGCENAVYPSTRSEFWRNKIDSNVQRDRTNKVKLRRLGWRIITVWECETSQLPVLTKRLRTLLGGTEMAEGEGHLIAS